jgi:hypothetical protein
MDRSCCAQGLAAGVLIAIGAPLHAHAQTPPIALEWKAPPNCPTQDAVLGEVVHVLGHVPVGAPVQARAEVMRAESGRWQAQLALATTSAQSQRLLVAESCEAIASATALIVAVAIEGGVAPTSPAGGITQPKSPQTAHPDAHLNDGRAPAAAPFFHSQLLVDAASVVDDGAMPSIAGGVDLEIGWMGSWRAWRVRVLASAAAFPDQTKLADQPALAAKNEGGDFRLLEASARACSGVVFGFFDLGPCLGAELDSMDAWGTPSAASPGHTNSHTSAQWVSLSGSALAEWQFVRTLALFARVEGLVPLAHPRFVIGQPGATEAVVHHPSAVALRLALGLEVRIF